jgi:4a-hydroxytetrahydrobiopterin dehydratase
MAAEAGDLAARRCVPCEGGTPALTREQYAPLLDQLAGWTVEEPADQPPRLVKSFRFKNFLEAVGFVNAITPIAEAEGHHPDLYVRWGEVRVLLWTHAAGGLTENDFILAAKIDRIPRA